MLIFLHLPSLTQENTHAERSVVVDFGFSKLPLFETFQETNWEFLISIPSLTALDP